MDLPNPPRRPDDPPHRGRYQADRSCPKCGHTRSATQWSTTPEGEVMVRQCGRCNFTWHESPLDEEG